MCQNVEEQHKRKFLFFSPLSFLSLWPEAGTSQELDSRALLQVAKCLNESDLLGQRYQEMYTLRPRHDEENLKETAEEEFLVLCMILETSYAHL